MPPAEGSNERQEALFGRRGGGEDDGRRRRGEEEGRGAGEGGGREKEGEGKGKKRGGKWKESFNLTDLTRAHVLDNEFPPSSPPLGGHTVRLEENPGSCTSC